MTMRAPTVVRLREAFVYDPETGEFTRRDALVRKLSGPAIDRTERRDSKGRIRYHSIKLDGVTYQAHRLAWLYVTGGTPSMIDHIDGNGLNNRFSNLRIATLSQNGFNRNVTPSPETGFRGVMRKGNKWGAHIKVRGKDLWLGRFDSPELASDAYLAAAKVHFGEFMPNSVGSEG